MTGALDDDGIAGQGRQTALSASPARYVPRSGSRLEFPQFKPLRSEVCKPLPHQHGRHLAANDHFGVELRELDERPAAAETLVVLVHST